MILVMNNTSRKIILVLLAIGVTAGILKIMGAGKEEKEVGEVKQTFKSVRVQKAELGTHKADVEFSGKLSAIEKIDLFTEVGGVLLTEGFKTGNKFSKGTPIAQLNSTEFAISLKASKTQLITQVSAVMGDMKIDFPDELAAWEAFLNGIDVDASLPKLPAVTNNKLKRFVAGKGILNSYYSLKSQEEKLSKFTINAPFNGVLTNATIKKGTLVRGGQKIGEFINPSAFEVEAAISISDLQFIAVGSEVELKSDDLNKTWVGRVARINSSLNANSQMVTVFVNIAGSGLKEGMFLHGSAKGASFENSVLVNRKLIKNGGLYLVEDGVIKHQKVEVLYTNQSTAIIQGLKAGQSYVSDNMKGLYDGMKVSVAK